MSSRIFLSSPDVGPLEESYLVRALRSGWVAPLGPEVEQFERDVAERAGTAGAVALGSGTAALHLALLALGAGPGTVVVVPTLTFVATANAVVYTGAEPVFVDCEPASGNIDVDQLAELLNELARAGRTVAAVVPVDMFGSCADYTGLLPVCAAAGVPVLEDAAEALGATHGGRPAGSFGHAGVFSFNGNKIITTSGGGMLVSDDRDLLARCRYLATQARQPVRHYEHTDVGYNYRLSNLLAALGRAQLRRLDGMMSRRRDMRDRYAKLFAGVAGARLLGDHDQGSNCWLTTLIVDPGVAGWRVEDLAADLEHQEIETRPVWKPMHLQPVFAGRQARVTGAAETLFRNGLTLPSGSVLGEPEIERVLTAISRFLQLRGR
ncbi:aminotransferase class I/II-fold pyridoxal phosphate-dependent enzyme [Micromonospora sp. NPDC007271]|uniref:DegT/DnrJ/EryC1/StrS family aminotransferase n=1 Tax=Micromonospora sp. NPDC007271 TaxID=3154587 RepID=UPI0033C1FF5D